MADAAFGHSGAGLFGLSPMYGGYPGGQAEYVRVPFADVGPMKIYEDLRDDQALFLSDIFPAGYMAAENCDIRRGDTIAVWGCGPVGLFALKSAFLLGADRVIAIDRVPERLRKARECRAETINCAEVDVVEALKEMTGGRGPDACIDAAGAESHGAGKREPLREAIQACRRGRFWNGFVEATLTRPSSSVTDFPSTTPAALTGFFARKKSSARRWF
jgi:threonine dehydrogenase-like Zn-dependent dehydrogenase